MSQNTKYVIIVIGSLFVLASAYSGLLIYNNKRGSGTTFNPLSIIFDKKDKVKESKYAIQETKQNAQYSASNTSVKTTSSAEDAQRMTVLNFYSDYLSNKNAGKSQDDTLAKYGTDNLKAEFKANEAGTDSLICAADGAGASKPNSASIISADQQDGYMNFSVQFNNNSSVVSSGQVHVVTSGSNNLVDGVACRRAD